MLRILLNNLKSRPGAEPAVPPAPSAAPPQQRGDGAGGAGEADGIGGAAGSVTQAESRALAREIGPQPDHASACAAVRRVLDREPDNFAALLGLADLLRRDADSARAEEVLHLVNRALALRPASAEALSLLGAALHSANRTSEAAEAYQLALAADPALRETRFILALVLFLLGRYREGFLHFSARHPAGLNERHAWTEHLPRWAGEGLAGRRLLIWTDWGGLGDELLFARYISMVREKYQPAELHVSCSAEDRRLFSLIPGVDQCFSAGGVLAVDCHIPLLDLPCIFGTDLASIPGRVPYLQPNPADRALWAARLAGLRGLKVGLCWSSGFWNQGQEFDRARLGKSMSLALLAGLAGIANLQLVSLQKGKGRDELANTGLAIHDFDADLKDMADTAALAVNLDLVITVDTSVSHLAGALGLPALVLLSQGSGSFWLTETETSPWYPGVRVLRQPYGGEWAVPAGRAIEMVRRFAAAGTVDVLA